MSDEDETPQVDVSEPERILDGFPVFPSRGGVVTDEMIRRLLDEEDEEIIARKYRGSSK